MLAYICFLILFFLHYRMSKHVVSTSPDNSTGISWPVPNANLQNLSRALRSSKPEVYYHLPDTAPLRDFKAILL